MPTLKSQPFIEYEFSDEEYTVASVFTELQTMYIETLLSVTAVTKANLSYVPGSSDSKEVYIYQQEFLRGRLEAFQELLNLSADQKSHLVELQRRKAASQGQESSEVPRPNFNTDYSPPSFSSSSSSF